VPIIRSLSFTTHAASVQRVMSGSMLLPVLCRYLLLCPSSGAFSSLHTRPLFTVWSSVRCCFQSCSGISRLEATSNRTPHGEQRPVVRGAFRSKMTAVCNVIILKWREKLVPVYAARWRLSKRTDGGPLVQDGCRAQCNNIKKRWEIGLAQTQDGGCVKEQMTGPLYKMAAVRNVIILKR
jgi:hypothetical protein